MNNKGVNMNEVVKKQFEGMDVRHHLDDNGDVWFVAKDVMDTLDIKSQAHALRKLDSDQRGEVEIQGEGGFRKLTTVSETGLYDLIMQSSKPSARPFQRWVTKEVLPSIRKTGSYSTQTEDPRMSQAKMFLKYTEHIIEQEKVNQELQIKNAVLESRIGSVDNTVHQLMRHRKGNDPIPDGMITLEKLRTKYFSGVTKQIASEYLNKIQHKSEPYTYVVNGAEYTSYCFLEYGLAIASDSFFKEVRLINETPKNIRVEHVFIDGPFWLSKETTPFYIQTRLLGKLL